MNTGLIGDIKVDSLISNINRKQTQLVNFGTKHKSNNIVLTMFLKRILVNK